MWYNVFMNEQDKCKFCGMEKDWVRYWNGCACQDLKVQMAKMQKAKQIENLILRILNKIWRKIKWVI
jgi:hypothetical protein